MTQRRRVPNVMRSRSKLNMGNIRNDSMADIKKFYGWSERQLEQNVRAVAGEKNSKEAIESVYNEAYKRKD